MTSVAQVQDHWSDDGTSGFLRDVFEGLSQPQKVLPCKYLYDARGATLFEEICQLEEYYPTRAELEIMQANAPEMASHIGPRAAIIEPGSGAGLKTRLLLEALDSPAAYIPIDISREQLERTARQVFSEFPSLRVLPIHADFAANVPLPPITNMTHMSNDGHERRRIVYFPGSTIGNFETDEAISFLKRLAAIAQPGGGLLIGIDLKKDLHILEAAYNDARGITAAFNLNLLRRINRELNADFDLANFEHKAVWNPHLGRIEMRLISTADQTVRVSGRSFAFKRGEWIHTESSHKYTPEEFAHLLSRSGWQAKAQWVDGRGRFGVLYADR